MSRRSLDVLADSTSDTLVLSRRHSSVRADELGRDGRPSSVEPALDLDDVITWTADDTGSHTIDRDLERELVRAALFDGRTAPRVGRFCVAERLGAGASSVVYAAWDELLARRVAVKIFIAESSATRRHVQREARALAQLSHRNVVAVHDAGEWNDHAFIAMELIAGTTLARWQADPKRATAELLDAYLQAGQGLSAAHQAGLVHRDFKPANVMVADDGRVVVTDFGLVRDVSTTVSEISSSWNSVATGAGSVVGTPAYVAPEQRRGTVPHPSADIYSFSMALCEALIGWHPMQRDEQAWQRALASRVPSRLHAAICTGLAVDPAARGETMAPLLKAIKAALPPHVTHRAARAPWREVLGSLAHSHRARRAGLATAGLAAGLAGLYLAARGTPATVSGRTTLPIFEATPHRLLASRSDAVAAAPPSRDDPRAVAELRSLLLQPLPTEVRCAWPAPIVSAVLGDDYAAGRDDRGRVYVCAIDTGEVSLAATGARCVVAGNRRTIGVMDMAGQVRVVRNDLGSWQPIPATDAPAAYTSQPHPVTRCSFTIVLEPDGTPRITRSTWSQQHDLTGRLAISVSDGEVRVRDRSSPTVLTTLILPSRQSLVGMEVSRDASHALVAMLRGPIYWWEAGRSGWHLEPLHFEAAWFQAHLSPSGRRVVLVDPLGRLEVRMLGGGRAAWLSSAAIKDAMFRDDDTVIGLDGDHRIWRWDLANQRSGIAAIHEQRVWSVASNQEVLVSGSEDGTVIVIDRASGAVRFQRSTNNQIYKVLLDGERLVTAGNDGLHIWNWRDGAPLAITSGRGLRIWDAAPATAPDGARFYLAGALRSGEISAWRRGTRTPIYRADWGARVDKIAISADGRTAAVVNSHGTLVVLDVAAQRVIAARPAHVPYWSRGVAFDPVTAQIVTAGDDGWLRMWSAGDVALLREVRVSSGEIYDLDVRAGRALIAAMDGIALVDLTTAQIVRRYRDHTTAVFTAKFRADGQWFVTGEQSGRACLWRIEDGACHTWLDGHTKGVVSAVFADDGTIFTSSHDGTVRFWRPTYDEPLEALLDELARHGSRP